MKVTILGNIFLGLAALVTATPAPASQNIEERQITGGNGPYGPAGYEVLSSLPRHTIYRPQNAAAAGQMPVFIWGNGACSADGTSARPYLLQIASFGFLVISQGTPGGGGSTNAERMREAVTWAANGAGGLFNVNRAKIMVAGYSCGGTEAYEFISDSRISSIGISNSGYLSNYDAARTIRKPIIFMLGGSSDIAYQNGERDYSYLPSGTPAWKGNLNSVGHGGTYGQTNGGLYAKVMVKWLQWVLKGDTTAAQYFSGNTAVSDGWSNAVSKSLNLIPTGGTTTTTTTTTIRTTTQAPTSTTTRNQQPTTTTPVIPTTTTTTTTAANTGGPCSGLWGQCAGIGWSGAKCCSQGTCKYSNDWYSQCLN